MDEVKRKFTTEELIEKPYRDLQKIAKEMKLPSNVKKIQMINLILANVNGPIEKIKALIDEVKKDRARQAQLRKRRTKRKQTKEISVTSSSRSQSPILATRSRRSPTPTITLWCDDKNTSYIPGYSFQRSNNLINSLDQIPNSNSNRKQNGGQLTEYQHKKTVTNYTAVNDCQTKMVLRNRSAKGKYLDKGITRRNIMPVSVKQRIERVTQGCTSVKRVLVASSYRPRNTGPETKNPTQITVNKTIKSINTSNRNTYTYELVSGGVSIKNKDGIISKVEAYIKKPCLMIANSDNKENKKTYKRKSIQNTEYTTNQNITDNFDINNQQKTSQTTNVNSLLKTVQRNQNINSYSDNNNQDINSYSENNQDINSYNDNINHDLKIVQRNQNINSYIDNNQDINSFRDNNNQEINTYNDNNNLNIIDNEANQNINYSDNIINNNNQNNNVQTYMGTELYGVNTSYMDTPLSMVSHGQGRIQNGELMTSAEITDYYHKKIRAESVRTRRATIEARCSRTEEDGRTSASCDVTQPLYVHCANDNTTVSTPYYTNPEHRSYLESLYNLPNQYLCEPPLTRCKTTTGTYCVYTSPLYTSSKLHNSTPLHIDQANIAPYMHQDEYNNNNISSQNFVNYGYIKTTDQDITMRNDYSTRELDSRGTGNESELPDMVADAFEIISQDGDYMERMGMEGMGIRMQCILCSWAGPKIILEHHILKEHSHLLRSVSSEEWRLECKLSQQSRLELLQTRHGAIFVVSTNLLLNNTLQVAFASVSDYDMPTRGSITIYNKLTGQPYIWEGDIPTLPPAMAYEPQSTNCFVLPISKLDLMPNSANLKLINGRLGPESAGVVIGCLGELVVEIFFKIYTGECKT